MSKPTLEVIQVDPCRAVEAAQSLFWLLITNIILTVIVFGVVVNKPDCKCSLGKQYCKPAACCETVKHEVEIKVTGNPKVEGTIIVAGDVDIRGKVEGSVPVIVFHDEKSSVGSLPAPEPKKPEPKKESHPRSAGCK